MMTDDGQCNGLLGLCPLMDHVRCVILLAFSGRQVNVYEILWHHTLFLLSILFEWSAPTGMEGRRGSSQSIVIIHPIYPIQRSTSAAPGKHTFTHSHFQ